MIVAAWLRWKDGHGLVWLALAAFVVMADLIVGPALIAWEIRILREVWGG